VINIQVWTVPAGEAFGDRLLWWGPSDKKDGKWSDIQGCLHAGTLLLVKPTERKQAAQWLLRSHVPTCSPRSRIAGQSVLLFAQKTTLKGGGVGAMKSTTSQPGLRVTTLRAGNQPRRSETFSWIDPARFIAASHRGILVAGARMSAADTIRKLIEQAGLSQREAANEIGVTQRTFRDWCAGKREPPRAVLMALELLSIKRKNQLLAGKLKAQVRTDGPFAIYVVTDDTLGKSALCGYVIEGPGSYSSWLLSAEQVGPELKELKAKLGR